jgi:hypothetical protein
MTTADGHLLWCFAVWSSALHAVSELAWTTAPLARMFETDGPIRTAGLTTMTAEWLALVDAVHELAPERVYVAGPAAAYTRQRLIAEAPALDAALALATLDTDTIRLWGAAWGLSGFAPVATADEADVGEVLRKSMVHARAVREWMGQRALFPARVRKGT